MSAIYTDAVEAQTSGAVSEHSGSCARRWVRAQAGATGFTVRGLCVHSTTYTHIVRNTKQV